MTARPRCAGYAASTAGMAFLPSYESVGKVAIIAMVLLRIGQGLALGSLLIAGFIAITTPVTTIFLMRAGLFRARRSGDDVPANVSRVAQARIQEP